MKTVLQSILAAFLGSATAAIAAEGAATGGTSPLVIFFLTFFALVVVFQLVPGLLLFVSALRALFSGARKQAPAADGEPDKTS